MADTNNLKNIDEVLNILNQINIENSSEVYIPSLKQSIKFKPLTEKHQTAIINVYNTSPIFDNDFNILFADILKELVIGPLDILKLNVMDKYCIAIQLKIANQGTSYTDFETKKTYDLSTLAASYTSKEFTIPDDVVLTIDDYRITIGLPTYKAELEFDNLVSMKTKNLNLDDEKPYRALLSEILFYMLLQYIKVVTIVRNDIPNVLNFTELNPTQKRKLGESLPSKIFDAVTRTIDQDFAPHLQKSLALDSETNVNFSPKLFLKLDK